MGEYRYTNLVSEDVTLPIGRRDIAESIVGGRAVFADQVRKLRFLTRAVVRPSAVPE
jgi:hypothetical protein